MSSFCAQPNFRGQEDVGHIDALVERARDWMRHLCPSPSQMPPYSLSAAPGKETAGWCLKKEFLKKIPAAFSVLSMVGDDFVSVRLNGCAVFREADLHEIQTCSTRGLFLLREYGVIALLPEILEARRRQCLLLALRWL